MFKNIILLSLLTIIYEINGEAGHQNKREQQNAYSLLDVPTKYADLRIFKTPPDMMTGRGFGKRNDENIQSNYGMENEIEEQDMINVYEIADENVQRSLPNLYFQDLLKSPKFSDTSDSSTPIKNHRLQLRDGSFTRHGGEFKGARGFGKRSLFH